MSDRPGPFDPDDARRRRRGATPTRTAGARSPSHHAVRRWARDDPREDPRPASEAAELGARVPDRRRRPRDRGGRDHRRRDCAEQVQRHQPPRGHRCRRVVVDPCGFGARRATGDSRRLVPAGFVGAQHLTRCGSTTSTSARTPSSSCSASVRSGRRRRRTRSLRTQSARCSRRLRGSRLHQLLAGRYDTALGQHREHAPRRW